MRAPNILCCQFWQHTYATAVVLPYCCITELMVSCVRRTLQGTLSISLCGARIPELLSAHGGWWQQQPTQLSAVLGYMLLLLDLLAAYLGGPLLHEGSFQGCTSVVWQQQSFWNRRPTSSNGVLPLFMEQGLVANAVAPLANTLPALPTLLPRNP